MSANPTLARARGREVVVVADGDADPALLRAVGDRGSEAAAVGPDARLPALGGPRSRPLIVAADGAAAWVLAADLRPDLVVGDGDSLDPRTREHLAGLGVPFQPVAAEKDESDTELCLLVALEAGVRHVSLVGAFGGSRPEHSLANVSLLADPRFDDLPITAWWQTARLRRVGRLDGPGDLRIAGAAGDWLSLLPLDAAVLGVRTEGLRYPLHGETLQLGPARGLSNELLGETARVITERGRLLAIHTPRLPAKHATPSGPDRREPAPATPVARSGGSHV
jgi:thiamine pyrophosphokinase